MCVIELCEIEWMCENKDVSVTFQKYKSFYAKCLNYKCNFQIWVGAKV
jgi:hypothetical protein